MGILDFFKPVPSWPVEKVRKFLKNNPPGDYCLLDVRQPHEYLQGHLPGAHFVPLRELFDPTEKLDPGRRTIVYCSTGIRSRAVASILIGQGFSRTVFMEGGFKAWYGHLAKGLPELAMTWFFPANTPEELVALAWNLEEGTRQFYSQVAELCATPELGEFYEELVQDEVRHQHTLRGLYEKFAGHPAGEDFPLGIIPLPQKEPVMEGVVAVSDALRWARGRSDEDILELTMAIEAVAYDRYLFMLKKHEGEPSRAVFKTLAAVERKHLEKVTEWFERLTSREQPSV